MIIHMLITGWKVRYVKIFCRGLKELSLIREIIIKQIKQFLFQEINFSVRVNSSYISSSITFFKQINGCRKRRP